MDDQLSFRIRLQPQRPKGVQARCASCALASRSMKTHERTMARTSSSRCLARQAPIRSVRSLCVAPAAQQSLTNGRIGAPGCLGACLCPCCAQIAIRRKALGFDMSKYRCCQGYMDGFVPCLTSGQCGETLCPNSCLCVEVRAATRTLRWTDRCFDSAVFG